MTDPERAVREFDGPNWPEILPEDDSTDAISSTRALAVVAAAYCILALIVLAASAHVVGLL